MELKGKTALVTGASSGIGREFAQQLAAQGMHLVITARNESALAEVKRTIEQKYPVKVEIIVDDLSTNAAPKRIFNLIVRQGMHIDLLVNNAGVGYFGKFEDEDFDKNHAMSMVNVVSLSSLTHLFIQAMLRKGEGGIINVASLAGLHPFPYAASYAATKAFVYNFSQALWEEYHDRGIIVSCVCPGLTRTNFGKVAGRAEMFERGVDPKIVVAEALLSFSEKEPIAIPEVHRNFLLEHGARFLSRKSLLKKTARMFKP